MTTVALALMIASTNLNLPKGLLSAICYVESRHNAKAVNPDDGHQDSIGLCQLHMDTARFMGYKGDEKGLLNPKTNAYYAGKYLRYQIRRYENDPRKAVAAYNLGHHKLNKKGVIVNKAYVEKVFTAWGRYK